MTVIDAEGQALWISEHLDLPLQVVEAVLALEFEFMVGVGIIDLPNYGFEIYEPEELRAREPIVDVQALSTDAEEKLGIMCEIAASILEKESDFLEMRGLISEGPTDH